MLNITRAADNVIQLSLLYQALAISVQKWGPVIWQAETLAVLPHFWNKTSCGSPWSPVASPPFHYLPPAAEKDTGRLLSVSELPTPLRDTDHPHSGSFITDSPSSHSTAFSHSLPTTDCSCCWNTQEDQLMSLLQGEVSEPDLCNWFKRPCSHLAIWDQEAESLWFQMALQSVQNTTRMFRCYLFLITVARFCCIGRATESSGNWGKPHHTNDSTLRSSCAVLGDMLRAMHFAAIVKIWHSYIFYISFCKWCVFANIVYFCI